MIRAGGAQEGGLGPTSVQRLVRRGAAQPGRMEHPPPRSCFRSGCQGGPCLGGDIGTQT